MHDIAGDAHCPKCHCAMSEVVGTSSVFGRFAQSRRCRFCGHTFRVTLAQEKPMQQAAKAAAFDHDPNTPVTYHSEPVRCECPYCQAKNPTVTKTVQREDGVTIRYHKCAACTRTFKSAEA
jgi:transposase-like protein